MRFSQLLWLSLSLAPLLTLPALSAPTTDAPTSLESLRAPAPPLATAATLESARRGTHQSDTRTIDLLVEMQQPTAGIQFNERATRGSSGEQRVRALPTAPGATTMSPQQTRIEAPPTPPSGLFGAGATPAVQARTANVGDPPSGGNGMSPRSSGRPSSDVPPELKRWLQGPRQLIEYVRENRAFVAGCAALLLVLGWTGSMVFSRRRG